MRVNHALSYCDLCVANPTICACLFMGTLERRRLPVVDLSNAAIEVATRLSIIMLLQQPCAQRSQASEAIP